MDEELKGTAAGSTGVAPDLAQAGIAEDGMAANHEAQILSNLLQSLDAGEGASGPVPNMLRAMGQEPPLLSSVEEADKGKG